jgi:outer membrane protein, heavy metal efflux system
MVIIFKKFSTIIGFFFLSLFGGTRVHAVQCPPFASSKDILNCALENHPDIQRAKLSLMQGAALESQAAQRPNPEFNSQGLHGMNQNELSQTLELNLAHTFELGGKRSSRIERAIAERESISASLLRTQETVYLETLSALYRVRQIRTEINTLNEALYTFGRILKQFKSRPKLGPDQQVSVGVFQVAGADYQLRKITLETEENTLRQSIALATATAFQLPDNLLPPRKKRWPETKELISNQTFLGSAIKVPQADLKIALGQLSIAQSQGWPDLRVGPSLQGQTLGPFSFISYGFNLGLIIPLYHANPGGKSVALRGIDLAEQSLALRNRELDTQLNILVKKYQNSVRGLETAISTSEIEKRHTRVEVLFGRGLIPSQLVIEAHRQIVDFTKTVHEHELSAIDSLWRIYILEGRVFQEQGL